MSKQKLFLLAILLVVGVIIARFAEFNGDDQPATALQSVPAVENYVDLVTGMEFIWIEGGCFEMGSPDNEIKRNHDDEGPVHRVCVDGFYMGKYEVTNRQYRSYLDNLENRDALGHSMKGEERPVSDVSWEDAMAYIEWFNRESGKTFRLPTEAEWEYAYRAGSKTSRFWGDSTHDACIYGNIADITAKSYFPDWTIHDCDDGYITTAPVGQFKANAFGLYDMVGNVSEWTGDWYGKDYYKNSPVENPQGPVTGDRRVLRGTSWDDFPGDERSAKRFNIEPDKRSQYYGFRLVLPSAK